MDTPTTKPTSAIFKMEKKQTRPDTAQTNDTYEAVNGFAT